MGSVDEINRPNVFEQLILRDRMRAAVVSAIGAWRAEGLFPPSITTIRIRVPERYKATNG